MCFGFRYSNLGFSCVMDIIFIECPNCHIQNRVPQEKVGQQAKCGKCGTPFITAEHRYASPVTVTDVNFSQEVLQSPLPVLVDVWAPWCGPCRMLAPVIEELAQEFAGRLKVAKLNSDENRYTASQYHIQGIPTLLFLKNGQLVDQVVGVTPKQHLISKIQQLL
jgi:thioredoxin 2